MSSRSWDGHLGNVLNLASRSCWIVICVFWKSCYCELISNFAAKKTVALPIAKGNCFCWLTFLIRWSLTLLQRGGGKVGRSLTCQTGIIAVCLGEVWGDGDEEIIFCHTLIHNLHLTLCQNLLKRCHSHFQLSFCLHLSGCVSMSAGLLPSFCLTLLHTDPQRHTDWQCYHVVWDFVLVFVHSSMCGANWA